MKLLYFMGSGRRRRSSLLVLVILFVVLLVFSLAVPTELLAAGEDIKFWPNSVAEANSSGVWPSIDEIPAEAWLVMDMDTGETVIAHNENERVYPASTTKIMTAITVLNDPDYDPERILTASAKAVDLSWDSSKIYLQEDETIVMKDAMAGLMLASGNDVANVLAESLSGSVEEFSRRLTVEALALGATETSFMNPHGLHDEDHYTTAYDLALISAAAMDIDEFRELVSARSYSLPASNKHHYNGWSLIMNTNRLMHFDDSYLYSPYIKEIKGIKTGTTSAAGFCLVTAAETHDGRELLSVLMGVPYGEVQGSTWIYTRTLLEEAAKKMGAPEVPYEVMIQGQTSDQTEGDNLGQSDEDVPQDGNINDTTEQDESEDDETEQTENEDAAGLESQDKDSWFWPVIIVAVTALILVIVIIAQQRKINYYRRRGSRRR